MFWTSQEHQPSQGGARHLCWPSCFVGQPGLVVEEIGKPYLVSHYQQFLCSVQLLLNKFMISYSSGTIATIDMSDDIHMNYTEYVTAWRIILRGFHIFGEKKSSNMGISKRNPNYYINLSWDCFTKF